MDYYLIASFAVIAILSAFPAFVTGIISSSKERGLNKGLYISGSAVIMLMTALPAYALLMSLMRITKAECYYRGFSSYYTPKLLYGLLTVLIGVALEVLIAFSVACFMKSKGPEPVKRVFSVSTGIYGGATALTMMIFIMEFGLMSMTGGAFVDFDYVLERLFNLGYGDVARVTGPIKICWAVLTGLTAIAFFVMSLIMIIKRRKEKRNLLIRISSAAFALLFALTEFVSVPAYHITVKEENSHMVVGKPVIYFFPEEELEVNVILENPEVLTVTYPEYEASEGWSFKAEPDGTLTADGKLYPYMYYEIDLKKESDGPVLNFSENGFVVPGKDTAKFLEEVLDEMGFNFKERSDFITYWLPKMAANEYNRVEFLLNEQVDDIMPITVTPQPDNIMRVYMIFSACDPEDIGELEEQVFHPFCRDGFAVLEWGAADLGESN